MSSFTPALNICSEAQEFLRAELTSPTVLSKIEEFEADMAHNEDGHYFELIAEIRADIDDIQCICSKTYSHGLCVCMIYFEGVFYSILQDAQDEQPLLDVRFPDVSKEGDGITIGTYDSGNIDSGVMWCKLSLWQCLSYRDAVIPRNPGPINATSAMYQQTYCALKPDSTSLGSEDTQAIRTVLFRFGSWCYSGEVELVPTLSIDDIPHVIPALRLQQSNLNFLCDVSKMPCDNIFTKPLMHMFEYNQIMERETISTEELLRNLNEESERKTIPTTTKNWLDCNESDIFLEFTVLQNHVSAFSDSHIDLIASKCYHPNGIVIMCVYFRGVFYMSLSNGTGDQPLLDSTFPSLVQGRGCRLKSYPSGLSDWPELRKMSIWQNASSFDNDRKQDFSDSKYKVEGETKQPEDIILEPTKLTTSMKVKSKVHKNKCIEGGSCDYEIQESCGQLGYDDDTPRKDKLCGQDSSEYRVRKSTMKKYLPCQIGTNIDSKEVQDTTSGLNRTANIDISTKQNLGAFHHLAPLKRSSKLESQIESNILLENMGDNFMAPWGSDGRPL